MATTHDDKLRDLLAEAGEVELCSYGGDREWVLSRVFSDQCRVVCRDGHEARQRTLYEGPSFTQAVAVAHEFMLTGKVPA